MKILLVVDDFTSRVSIRKLLEEMGHQIKECADGETALIELAANQFDLILSVINIPNISGMDLQKTVINLGSEKKIPVILLTGDGTLDTVIDALRIGAADCLLKPVKADELVNAIRRIESKTNLDIAHPLRYPTAASAKSDCFSFETSEILVFSKVMADIVKRAEIYHSDRSIPVLIQGETGTGKELIARVVHSGGKPTVEPFIDVNCAAITPSLFESELFGYESGAFTGGLAKGQKGKFDLASGGTLFLDEVGEIPLQLQGKFLRVLQEKEFYRVGGIKKVTLDARLICATNVNLLKAIEQGKFRLDLYHRLKVGEIYIPPLRERKEEIIPLAMTFLQNAAMRKGKDFTKISPGAERLLLSYEWPGNVRELMNTIEKAVLLFDADELSADHLESIVCRCKQPPQKDIRTEKFSKNLNAYVKDLVEMTLEKHNGNKTATAKELCVSRGALYRLLERLNIADKKRED